MYIKRSDGQQFLKSQQNEQLHVPPTIVEHKIKQITTSVHNYIYMDFLLSFNNMYLIINSILSLFPFYLGQNVVK